MHYIPLKENLPGITGLLALEEGKTPPVLHDIDFLLGVHDGSRMGALRFKLNPEGPFLNNDTGMPVPPWANIRELQHGANNSLNWDLAKSVGEYFRLTHIEMSDILKEVKTAVSLWSRLANEIGIPRGEQQVMAAAFRI